MYIHVELLITECMYYNGISCNGSSRGMCDFDLDLTTGVELNVITLPTTLSGSSEFSISIFLMLLLLPAISLASTNSSDSVKSSFSSSII